MGWFWDEYRANVREYRRTWKRRVLRRLVSVLLVILVTPIAMLVRYVTGSNAAGAIVGVPLLVFAVFVWWWIEDRLYADADARYFAQLDAEEARRQQVTDGASYHAPTLAYWQPTAATLVNDSGALPATVLDDPPPSYAQAAPQAGYPPVVQSPQYSPAGMQPLGQPVGQPQSKSSGGGWALLAMAIVGGVLLMCGGVVGGGMLLVSRVAPERREAFERADEHMADMRRRHDEQMREIRQRHEAMRLQMERDRERMRRPGW